MSGGGGQLAKSHGESESLAIMSAMMLKSAA